MSVYFCVRVCVRVCVCLCLCLCVCVYVLALIPLPCRAGARAAWITSSKSATIQELQKVQLTCTGNASTLAQVPIWACVCVPVLLFVRVPCQFLQGRARARMHACTASRVCLAASMRA